MTTCWTCGVQAKNSCQCGATICDRHSHVWLDDVADQINKNRKTRCFACHIDAPEAWRKWQPRPYTRVRAISRGEWEADYDF